MDDILYDKVINHANNNYTTTGRGLFNTLERIDNRLAELDLNRVNNYSYIDHAEKHRDYIMQVYADKNHIK